MEKKVQKKCRKVIFSAFLILAPEPYCQILLILHKLAEFSRFLDGKYNQGPLLARADTLPHQAK